MDSQLRYDTRPPPASVKASSRWSTRIIPFVLLGIYAFVCYSMTTRIWLEAPSFGATRPDGYLIVLYILLVMNLFSYANVFVSINTNPGATPTIDLSALNTGNEPANTQTQTEAEPKRPSPCHLVDRLRKPKEPVDQLVIRKFRYELTSAPNTAPEHRLSIISNSESAGPLGYFPSRRYMEHFYTRDVFVCDPAGFPVWCNKCRIWKPDRAHHSSEMERCIRKMDHYCPWVGGMVSETSFNFFVQFTFYAFIFSAFVLAISAENMVQRAKAGVQRDVTVTISLSLACLFTLFTGTMTLGSLRYILLNLTNVEHVAQKSKIYHLAIRIPNGSSPTDKFQIRTFPLADWHQTHIPSHPAVEHTFAIVQTEKGENPWKRGYYDNWVSVMGSNPLAWFLPIWHSPCMFEDENATSQYKMGPLVDELRVRYGLPPM